MEGDRSMTWQHLTQPQKPKRTYKPWQIAVGVFGVLAVIGGVDQISGGALSRLGDPAAQQQQLSPFQPDPGAYANARYAANTGLWQPAPGQSIPPPVDLPIQNLRQETEVWCWAAVSQQIILASRGPQATPPQCALVAMANGADPGVCCNGYNQQCVTTGSLDQIQKLIAQFGGRYSNMAAPTDPMTLYQALAGGHAVILALQSQPGAGHVVVVRGMSFAPTQGSVEPVLHVNDPMAVYTQPVPFRQLVGVWKQAIVIN
jgi:hypothetical protein